mmetsp:Transcript_16946/g.48163  ORF Transcript_16946/g.48163 Transcript_16946/m.48163 type:complete len:244 (-) Transcript_16946:772-1503(-)
MILTALVRAHSLNLLLRPPAPLSKMQQKVLTPRDKLRPFHVSHLRECLPHVRMMHTIRRVHVPSGTSVPLGPSPTVRLDPTVVLLATRDLHVVQHDQCVRDPPTGLLRRLTWLRAVYPPCVRTPLYVTVRNLSLALVLCTTRSMWIVALARTPTAKSSNSVLPLGPVRRRCTRMRLYRLTQHMPGIMGLSQIMLVVPMRLMQMLCTTISLRRLPTARFTSIVLARLYAPQTVASSRRSKVVSA